MTSDGTVVDDAPTDAPLVDAMMDAPRMCLVEMSFPTLALGSEAQPLAFNFFHTPTSGTNAGKVTFSVSGGLDGSTPAATDAMLFEVVKPAGGFQTNTPYPFDANPIDGYTAAAMIYADLNTTTGIHQALYSASNGSITFTSIGESDGSSIAGSVTMTMYREIDEAQGTDIPGGCTTSLAGMTFHLTQQMM